MPVTILITRPEPEAGRFAARLRAVCGPQTEILCAPVMRIAWRGTLPPLRGDEVLIFTSRHGVGGFCALTARRGFTCYCVGEATAQAARAQGLMAIACGGDAAALLDRIATDGATGPFLHLRGAHVAADITGALQAAGHEAQETVVYDQQPQDMGEAARRVLAGEGAVILPLMSPRSARLAFSQVSDIHAPLFVAAISRNTAKAVPEGAAQKMSIAQRPDAEAVADAVHDLVKEAKRLEGGKRAQ
ncbi:uroporphyrinogen-III synthase [Roseovarius sp. A-2]|uniref:uroporphyrinogen-III synthase n=1 Tax=Roseovarius sp. A-2 TaxID=1570360 RepID=UPI0009B5344D|nr:uroporphyrinogen-III synthase [Roseovarius sp. A-2]GAW34605.1 uroporphyrinogen-III synthase [Roseovarius sp. A-2]